MSTLNELLKRARELPPMTEREQLMQGLGFSYANLALTTNHKPQRKAFKVVAMKRGLTESEFNTWADGREWW